MSRSFIHLWYVSCSIVEFCGNSFVKSSVRLLCLAGTKVDLPQKKKKKKSDQLNALKVALAFFVMLIGFKPFFSFLMLQFCVRIHVVICVMT